MIDLHDDAAGRPARASAGETLTDMPLAWRWTLATFSVAAGAIHLAMAPSHLGESAVEGTGFIVAAWLQLGLAAAVVARPTRIVLWAIAGVNAALIGAWIVSRTAGLPFGEHSGHAESASFIDVSCVVLEAALVVGALIAATRPEQITRIRTAAPSYALSFAALALATAAIASPSAQNHAAESHGDHHATANGGDAAGHEHGATRQKGAAAGHDHGDGTDDNGLAQLTNGHQHDSTVVELDAKTRRGLNRQLRQTQQLIDKYPTAAEAIADGYHRAGPFSPGLGTHYLGPNYHPVSDGTIDRDDMPHPMLIFDGNDPSSPLAGFMYLSTGTAEPEGFIGPNDHWHYHEKVCLKAGAKGIIDTPFGADLAGVTRKMCTKVGGNWISNTGYMVHVWNVPGYENERGVFAEINPKLICPDETYTTVPLRQLGTRKTACVG